MVTGLPSKIRPLNVSLAIKILLPVELGRLLIGMVIVNVLFSIFAFIVALFKASPVLGWLVCPVVRLAPTIARPLAGLNWYL